MLITGNHVFVTEKLMAKYKDPDNNIKNSRE